MALGKLIDLENLEYWLRRITANLNFARDINDRLRVVVDSGAVNIYTGNSGTSLVGAGNQPGYYSTSAWNLQDAREVAREASEMHFAITRQRWTIT